MVDGCTSEQMRALIGDCYAVVNSKTALKHWDLPRAGFIRHGLSPSEWPTTSYKRKNVVMVQPGGPRHEKTRNQAGISLVEKKVKLDWIGRDLKMYSLDEYKNYLSSSSVFFNPSFASCNPRARTEAMLCGLAVVTTNCHGEDEFIVNGKNGFCSNDINELIDYLRLLISNPTKCKEIGIAGQETAREIFHIDNFIAQWNETLQKISNDRPSR